MGTIWIKFRLGQNVECKWYDYDYDIGSGNQMHATDCVITGSGAISEFPNQADSWSQDYPVGWGTNRSRIIANFNVVDIPEEVTSLCRGFCDGWRANTLNIGSQITEIPQRFISASYAFNTGLGSGIKYIRFPNGCNVTRVNAYAFDIDTTYAQMDSLIEIDLNDNILEYGEYCFYKHNKLTKFSLHNNLKGIVGNAAFLYCQDLIEFNIESTASISLNTNTFYVNPGQGQGYHDDKLITYVTGDRTKIAQIDWSGCNRYLADVGKIIRLKHLGNIIEINGYSSGLLPFEHLGNIYWLRECQNGDANQSPLVVKHEGTLHYISK